MDSNKYSKCAFEQIIGSSVHYNVKQVWITWYRPLILPSLPKRKCCFGKLGIAATKRNNFDGKWWKGAAFAKQSNILFHRSCVATGCDVRILWPLTFDFWHAIASSESYSPVEEPAPTLSNESALCVRTCFPIPLPIFKRYVINYRGILVILVTRSLRAPPGPDLLFWHQRIYDTTLGFRDIGTWWFLLRTRTSTDEQELCILVVGCSKFGWEKNENSDLFVVYVYLIWAYIH